MALSSFHYLKSFKNITQNMNKCLGKPYSQAIYNTSYFQLFFNSFSPGITIVAEKQTEAEELGLPKPPKKPRTPYFHYLIEKFKKYPNLKSSEKVSKIAESWKALEDSAKTKYFNEFTIESATYKERLLRYTESLSPDQIKKKVKKVKSRKPIGEAELRAKRMKRLERDSLGKPKLPRNSFNLFVEKISKTLTVPKDSKFLLCARDMWNGLEESEKEKYEREAKERLSLYYEQLSVWEEKMIEQGRLDLVRKKSLKSYKK